jgi:GMP synthase PP-ATPase subunit
MSQKANKTLKATLSVHGMPEVLASMRHEIAEALREFAKDEDRRVAARLKEIADLFEIGQTSSGS